MAACARHAEMLWGAGPARPAEEVGTELVERYAVEPLRGRRTHVLGAGPRDLFAVLNHGRAGG